MLSQYNQISRQNPSGSPKTSSSTSSAPTLTTNTKGNSNSINLEEAGKHAIMHRTDLPTRNLWILDLLLSYPFIVLGRERAVVINLEHIKAIITKQEVLLLNFRDPSTTPFVEELQRKLNMIY
ncbi:hypothetical protein SADUNF_Sadunf01G0111500 [Salix dunnii]|uniref:Uncharacterized protein n=1 Tax=Salix dunnii TaxID=1413687 RepID=A0A835NAR8_9ROSI|nr:hypothetical protein SADUNF_Sadunf01G0111500 [Salix dunnii]